MIAALYVEKDGCYYGLEGVDPWDEDRDARLYAGPHPVALAKHGYEKARRIGMMAMVGGKDKTKIRDATPIAFRDLLIGMARSAAENRQVA